MRLKCALARRLLPAFAGRELPAWIDRHIISCPGCAAEARAYAELVRTLGARAEDMGKCELTWERVRACMVKAPVRVIDRRRPVAVWAAACAVVLLVGIGVWFAVPHGSPTTGHAVRLVKNPPAPPAPKVEQDKPTPQPPAARQGEQKPKQKAPAVEQPRKAAPRIRHRIILPPRKEYYVDNRPADRNTEVAAAVPEEHVIEVVGVSMDQGNEAYYVIDELTPAETDGGASVPL